MQHFIPFAFLKAFTAKLFPSGLFAIKTFLSRHFYYFLNSFQNIVLIHMQRKYDVVHSLLSEQKIVPFLRFSVRFVFPLVEIFPHKNVINNWKKNSSPCYQLLMCCDIDVPSVAAKSFILPLSVYLTRLINSVLPWDSNKLNCLLHSFSKSVKQFQKWWEKKTEVVLWTAH